ncbi:MAG: hypothetical protein H6982_07765 [Chromatiales bacterium]|nr:hypothetical protein [Chromatiales bacterium]
MRKEYGKVLRSVFAARMKTAAVDFPETKVKSMYFWPGDRAYCWKVDAQLHCWIVLSPSDRYEQFTVLVGWSTLGRYPELGMVPSPREPTPDRSEFEEPEYLTRLAQLWTDEDAWWVVEPFAAPESMAALQASIEPIPAAEARARVTPVVENAIAKVTEVAIPYLRERAASVAGGP